MNLFSLLFFATLIFLPAFLLAREVSFLRAELKREYGRGYSAGFNDGGRKGIATALDVVERTSR